MDTAKIKSYAPKARKAFIDAIARQAAMLGITEKGCSPIEIKGDIALIDGKPHPAAIAKQRRGLEKLIEQQGYQQSIEKIAYSWFNRLVALRYMELHNYLDHGRRVLSHPEQDNAFQILEECTDIDMEGLDKQQVIQLKLAGDKDEELFRLLLLAQCHQLHQAMGFLFEAVDDASELLLPHNLTKTDSLIRQLVNTIPEELWQNVEIIGWLYQFYISEKKDQVIGKVVKSEDIPAATQLFTPNWIVKYLVQNSIGRQWLMTYPDSPLKGQMEYYIEPAEQTAEVQAQLKAITPDSIDPQTIKVLDPACGSGHILVEAYDLLKAIYTERGFRSRDIPQLILEYNLFGLDIDDRAAQLAGFALLMKARADDRRIFERNINFSVLALQSSQHLNPLKLWNNLNLHGQWQKQQTEELFGAAQGDLSEPQNDVDYKLIAELIERFQQAKTFGSLIDVPHNQQATIERLYEKLRELSESGDIRQKPATLALLPILHQALLLSQRYDAVVANPPYMGSKGMNTDLKVFAKKQYPNSKSDLFAIFMEHAFGLLNENGHSAQVNMQSWMFLSSYEKLREWLLDTKTFISMVHLGARAFGQISGEVVQTTAWVLNKTHVDKFQPVFFRLIEGNEDDKKQKLVNQRGKFSHLIQSDFLKVPGFSISYWESIKAIEKFDLGVLSSHGIPKQGISTCNDGFFLRIWYEVDFFKFNKPNDKYLDKNLKWFPFNKGGGYRKWYGNNVYALNWENEGEEIHTFNNVPMSFKGAPMRGKDYFFREGMSWAAIASGSFNGRYCPEGYAFAGKGPMLFPKKPEKLYYMIGVLNSVVADKYFKILSPTLDYTQGAVGNIPYVEDCVGPQSEIVEKCIAISILDWNSYESSWDFARSPLLQPDYHSSSLKVNYHKLRACWEKMVADMKKLEESSNRNFIVTTHPHSTNLIHQTMPFEWRSTD